MLHPDHQVDLPQQYVDARAARRFSSLTKWPILILVGIFAIVFIWIGEFPLLFVVIGLGYLAIVLTRRYFVRRVLLRYRGKLCPCCWHLSDDTKPGCKGCESPAGKDVHRAYWRLMRLTVVGAEQWFGDQFRAENKPPPLTRLVIVFIAIVIAIPILTALYIVLMTALFNDLSWISGMSAHGMFWVLYFPTLMVSGYFAKRRIGTAYHCAACEYQLAPVGPKPETCPECGADLSKNEAVSKGRQIGSWWGVLAPALLFIVVGFAPLFATLGDWKLSPSTLVPTSLLVEYIISTDDIDYQLEQEIESRRLDDGQITGLLDEIEHRMQAGVSFGMESNDPNYWGMNVAGLIATEAGQRSLPHPTKLRLLTLSRAWEDDIPYDIEKLVDSDVQAGIFSQAELQAAEMLRPIKRVTTTELVKQVVSSEEIDWRLEDELQLRSLDDEHIVTLLDEMTRRLSDGKDLNSYDDMGRWGHGVGDLVLAKLRSHTPSRSVSLRLLSIALNDQDRIPGSLKRWIHQAQFNGELRIDEPVPERK